MQLCLASNNLEGQFSNNNINDNKIEQSSSFNNNEIEDDDDDDEDNDDEDDDNEEEEEGDEEEEERINHLNTDKNYKLKTLKRLNEETENKNETSTVQTLIAAAAATSGIDRNQSKKSRIAAIPGKPRGATYDGNSCMICSDRASGFHYGVLACEGCKGFFKRICKEPNEMQSKRHCVYGGSCDINLRTRNRCQYCRIQKCIQLGMSKEGIKLGRRSRKFKENLVHIVSSTTNNFSTSTSTTTISSLNTQISSTSSLSTNQNIMSSFQDHHHHHSQQNTSNIGGVKLISQMCDTKLSSNDRQQHSNSLINTNHNLNQQNIIINNNQQQQQQLIAINTTDSQIQQFLLPTTGLFKIKFYTIWVNTF
jgi:hypothetical protein